MGEQRAAIANLIDQVKELRQGRNANDKAEKWRNRAKKLGKAFVQETSNTREAQAELDLSKERVALLTEKLQNAERDRRVDMSNPNSAEDEHKHARRAPNGSTAPTTLKERLTCSKM